MDRTDHEAFDQGVCVSILRDVRCCSQVLKAKGVGHFWDQVLTHASGRDESFHLKLASADDEESMAMEE